MKKLIDHNNVQSADVGMMFVETQKSVQTNGSDLPTTVVELKHIRCEDYAETIEMPTTEDYRLEVMLRNGIIPKEVPCSGLLDSQDPTDLQNQGVEDTLFDRLSSVVDAQEAASKPAQAVSKPETEQHTTE